jgi:acetylornithine deacetylase/succinyl-diaminopimelate desuccinylase-like protein
VARARLNVRSAPGQQTDRLAAALIRRLRVTVPTRLVLTIRSGTPVPPAELTLNGIGLSAARTACLATFGRPPILTRSGGTIAAVSHLQCVLGTSVVPLGFVPPGSRVHATGERWPECMLRRAAETVLWFLLAVAGS